jgi:hypothetical protein
MLEQNSSASRGENAKLYLTVIASAAKQSTLAFLLPHGLLRFARNDGSGPQLPGIVIIRESG